MASPSRALTVTRMQAVAHRLHANNLTARLPEGSYQLAARFALQDSGPRDALLGLHARVKSCEPDAWQDAQLVQTYSPRAAVHLLPAADFGVFTVGRFPLDPEMRRIIAARAEAMCQALDGRELRAGTLVELSGVAGLRTAAASGRIAIRWTASALYVREVPVPEVDFDEARVELCRRHVTAFGPTTPAAFAWWAGLSAADARQTWNLLSDRLLPVDLEGAPAWILAEDEPALTSAPPASGVRFLPPADLRLFGRDRTGRFAGPGQHHASPLHDTFHPGGLMVDGEIIGAWGRRGGRVQVRVGTSTASARRSAETRAAVEAEAVTIPIPGEKIRLDIAEV